MLLFALKADYFEIVPLHQQVSAIGVADRQVRAAFEQAEGHFLVMIDDGVFTDPVERGHLLLQNNPTILRYKTIVHHWGAVTTIICLYSPGFTVLHPSDAA